MRQKYSKILVTGGAGFIGSHVVDALLREGMKTTVLDSLNSGCLENIREHVGKEGFSFSQGDVRDYRLVWELVKDVDVVIHLAALTSIPESFEEPLLYNSVNVAGTLELLRASLNSSVERFIYASSCAIYGNIGSLPIEESSPLQPGSPYAISKMAAEAHVNLSFETFGLKTVCLRLLNVYGPRQTYNQYSGVITQFLNCLKENRPLVVFGDGNQTRDFIHVNDVVEAHMLALNSNVAGEVLNIGTGVATRIDQLAKMMLEIEGRDSSNIVYSEPRKGDVRHSVANISRARDKIKFEPKVPLREGVRGLLRIS